MVAGIALSRAWALAREVRMAGIVASWSPYAQ
jgi:hypothetical protein